MSDYVHVLGNSLICKVQQLGPLRTYNVGHTLRSCFVGVA